mgnify:CR=1 FL=1
MGITATIILNPLELHHIVSTNLSLQNQTVLIFQNLSNVKDTITLLNLFFAKTPLKIKSLNNKNIDQGDLFLTSLDNLDLYNHFITSEKTLPVIMGNADEFTYHHNFRALVDEAYHLSFFTPKNCSRFTRSVIEANFAQTYQFKIPIKTPSLSKKKIYYLPKYHFEFFKYYEQIQGDKSYLFEHTNSSLHRSKESLPPICLFLSSQTTKVFLTSQSLIKHSLHLLSARHIYIYNYFFSLSCLNTCSTLKMMQYFIYRLFLDQNYDRRYLNSQNAIPRTPYNR